MKKFGIDISRWQGNFNLPSAISEGVTFAIIKGGGGDDGLYKDSKFERNYDAAKKAALPVGVYWFSKALSADDAIREADYFYDNVLKGKQFELPIFIDVEHKQMLALGKDKLTEIVDKWCSHMEKKGYWVGIYSGLSFFTANMNDALLKKYTHWVAQWSNECTYPDKEVLGFWQFGGDVNLLRANTVAGVVCDQNYMYFDFPTLIKDKGLNGFTKEAAPPANAEKKTDAQIANQVLAGMWGNGTERKTKLTEAGYDYSAIQSLVNKLVKDRDKKRVKAGDLARLSPDGVIYGTDKKFAGFVYTTLLYVRELNGNRAVISIQPEGHVTGAVDVKYLTRFDP